MSDPGGEPARPSWPGQPGDGSGGPAPSWAGVGARRRVRRRDVNLKLVIAVLIGLVSVTGAVMTWRAARYAEEATDKDRQAVAETVVVQQNNANVETQLRDEQAAFVQYRADLANAELLALDAEALAAAGLEAEARAATDEAAVQRELADRLASLTFSLDYVIEDAEGNLSFDEDRRRDDLRQQNEAAFRVDPDSRAEEAVDLRQKSQRLVGWIVPLVGAIVLLTVAQVSRRAVVRTAVAAGGVAVYAVATVAAVTGAA